MEVRARGEGCEAGLGETYNFRDIGLARHDALCTTSVGCSYVQLAPRVAIVCRYVRWNNTQAECQSPEVLIGCVRDWSILSVTKTPKVN